MHTARLLLAPLLLLSASAVAQSTHDVVLVADPWGHLATDAAATRRVEWVDYDADGDLDLFALNYDAPNAVYGNRMGVFAADTRPGNDLLDASLAKGVAFGDLDGDGDLDAVIANGGDQANHVLLNLSAWPDDSPGMFLAVRGTGIEIERTHSYDVALGDLDGDGALDLVVVNRYDPCDLYQGHGDGTFRRDLTTPISRVVGGGRDVDLADLDGDGDLDVLMAFSGGEDNLVFVNQGFAQGGSQGEFTIDSIERDGSRPGCSYGLALGDLDRDGDPDLAIANRNEPNALLRNMSRIAFVGFERVLGSVLDLDADNSFDVAIGDLEGDGDPDLVFANGFGQDNALYLGLHAAPLDDPDGFRRATDSAVCFDGGDSRSVALADVYGYPDPVTGAPVTRALEMAIGNSSDTPNCVYRGYGPQWQETDAYPAAQVGPGHDGHPYGTGTPSGAFGPGSRKHPEPRGSTPLSQEPESGTWLTGHGCPLPGCTVLLKLVDGQPTAPAALALGLLPAELPFKGGLLLVDPSRVLGTILFVQPIDDDGNWSLRVALPKRLPLGFEMGLAAYFQVLSADRLAIGGVELSNGLRMRFTQ